MAVTAWTVTARRARPCESYPRCYRGIRPGEEYARHVAFPGDDANNSPVPWVLNLCRHCQTEYDRPMPPRRAVRKKVRRA